MSGYKIGDLSRLFDSPTQSKSASPNVEDKKSKSSLFGKAEKINNKPVTSQVKQKDMSKEEDIQSAIKIKTQIEEEKKKQRQKQGKGVSTDTDETLQKSPTTTKKGKKRKKTKEKEKLVLAPGKAGFDPPPGIIHESLLPKGKKRALDQDTEDVITKKKKKALQTEEDADKPQRKRFKVSHTKDEDKRTIFIGNLSLQVKEKELLKMFKEFGEIETFRRRCVPVKDPDELKRVVAIKQEYHPERHNSNAYIKFKTEEAAQKALVNNGKLVKNLHIHVDIADGSNKKDTKRTVFIANLPFDVEEESVWAHFEDCGNIENVRIVRDRKTCLGKGIGYVKFSDPGSVGLALKLNGSSFKERVLRVQLCQYDKNTENSKNKSGDKAISKSDKKKVKPTASAKKQDALQKERAKRLKKEKRKSNFKSNTSVLFAANKPTSKTVNKALDVSFTEKPGDGGKHIRFDNALEGKSTFKDKRLGFKSNKDNKSMKKTKFSKDNSNDLPGRPGKFPHGKGSFSKASRDKFSKGNLKKGKPSGFPNKKGSFQRNDRNTGKQHKTPATGGKGRHLHFD